MNVQLLTYPAMPGAQIFEALQLLRPATHALVPLCQSPTHRKANCGIVCLRLCPRRLWHRRQCRRLSFPRFILAGTAYAARKQTTFFDSVSRFKAITSRTGRVPATGVKLAQRLFGGHSALLDKTTVSCVPRSRPRMLEP